MSDPDARAPDLRRDRLKAMLKRTAVAILLFGSRHFGRPLHAQRTLFFLELQAVGAYSTAPNDFELFSLMPDDVMQKPSLGFDFVRRFSGRSRDIGVLAVQARLAYDEQGEHQLEPQLYNAYFGSRPGSPTSGRAQPARARAVLRSWTATPCSCPPRPCSATASTGIGESGSSGISRGATWPLSLTTGSGMPLHFKGNFLAAARVSKGVLARDNYSVGLSLAHGDILETMGYALVDPEPFAWSVGEPRRAPISGGTSRTGPRSSSAAATARDVPPFLAVGPGPPRRGPAQGRGPAGRS